MTNRKAQPATEVTSVATLQSQLAEIESEFSTALTVQDHATQVSIWAYNAMAVSDAFIARSEHEMLIKRLGQVSYDADTIKADSDALVRRLRDRKRELTKQIGSHVNDQQMVAERERAEKKMKDAAQVQIDAHAQVESVTSQAKKQTASKKKAA